MEMVPLQRKFVQMEEHKESTKDETCLPMVSLWGWDEMMQSCSIYIKQRRRDYDQHTRAIPILYMVDNVQALKYLGISQAILVATSFLTWNMHPRNFPNTKHSYFTIWQLNVYNFSRKHNYKYIQQLYNQTPRVKSLGIDYHNALTCSLQCIRCTKQIHQDKRFYSSGKKWKDQKQTGDLLMRYPIIENTWNIQFNDMKTN